MYDILKRTFGFDSFRPFQEEIIRHALSGQDALVVMPTGSGKSLCYQIPALLFDGLTLVISPLIALMKDQVDALRVNGVKAAYINSSLSQEDIQITLEAARLGQIRLLYLAPERLAMPAFQLLLQRLPVRFITVDEAHCISEWGHDFRPDYRTLSALRQIFPHVPWMALTATANERVRADIIKHLAFISARVFLSSFNRPNLTYIVRPKQKTWLDTATAALRQTEGSSAIVYCFSRQETERVANKLRERGFNALPYHAGLDERTRRETQEKFIRDECPIIVATIAFGMGIDKPNVRLVIHVGLPRSVEGYYQETGRAGRDSLPSTCLFFYAPGDRWKREYFIRQISDPAEQRRARDQLANMIRYAETSRCRRVFLLNYFGETWEPASCLGCDICLGEQANTFSIPTIHEKYDVTLFEALRALRKRLADERRVPAYMIFGDRSLREMARLYPQSLGSLKRIAGVGQEKERAFGDTFLQVICAHAQKIDQPDLVQTTTLSPSTTTTSCRPDTLEETKKWVEQKLPLEKIAQRRGFVVSTIVSHLEKLVEQGLVDISYLQPESQKLEKIQRAFMTSQTWNLTSVRKNSKEEFSFEELRLARLFLRKK